MYENVHPNLALLLLFVRTEEECGKGLILSLTESLEYEQRISLNEDALKTTFLGLNYNLTPQSLAYYDIASEKKDQHID